MQEPDWGLSEEFWGMVEPMIPERRRITDQYYQRRSGGGRKGLPHRQIFAAILYVLKNHCAWNELPEEYGSPGSINRYFNEWDHAGLFGRIWRKGLAEHVEMAGIAWEWRPDEDNERTHIAATRDWHRNRLAPHREWHPVAVRRNRSPHRPGFNPEG